jgi:hypothetical protein
MSNEIPCGNNIKNKTDVIEGRTKDCLSNAQNYFRIQIRYFISVNIAASLDNALIIQLEFS